MGAVTETDLDGNVYTEEKCDHCEGTGFDADACLRAAARELLEALRDHLAWYDGGSKGSAIDETELVARTRAVLAKAEGER